MLGATAAGSTVPTASAVKVALDVHGFPAASAVRSTRSTGLPGSSPDTRTATGSSIRV